MLRTTNKPVWLKLCVLLALCVPVSGCYYLQAATGQWRVMQQREPISDVIGNEDTPEALRNRLRLVQAARQFAVDELLLPDNDSYRSYADIEREFVVWNVFAAPEFSLQAKRWCFPVAGCVSYRGYFSREAAGKAARRLEEDGFDVYVGGVSAYSTLGNFSDPVLSSMMRWDDIRLVGVLFHELAHQVLYVKGDTGFNEAFATAVEEQGIERWLRSRGEQNDIATYEERRALRRDMMALVAKARGDLRQSFASKIDDAGKRRLKRARLQQLGLDVTALLARTGRKADGWRGDELNNARLASMTLYEARLPAFRALLANCNNDMRCFYDRATALSRKDRAARDAALDELAGSQPGVVVSGLDEP
ncbi:MAG: aminopeptidase [Woeseiaceae bacterium]|nr:aminopeptidase [Woeseiaceae bacterium]